MAAPSDDSRQPPKNESLSEEELELVTKLNTHVHNYPIQIPFPASVSSSFSEDPTTTVVPLRTDPDFIQHRLIENGLAFDDFQSIGQVTEALSGFVSELEQSGCYDTVRASLGKQSQELASSGAEEEQLSAVPGRLDILLKEKKWYKVYIGGGVKQDTKDLSFSSGPKVKFETNVSLLNLKGCTDKTRVSYEVDQACSSTVSLTHDAPLYSFFGKNSLIQNYILLSSGGSKKHACLRLTMDTLDFEHTRSYKELQRLLSFRMSNVGNIPRPEMANGPWNSLDWSLVWRDIMPRRLSKSPFACDASPDIVAQTGPSVKHSLMYDYRLNNRLDGLDVSLSAELAGPPGDVGFAKCEGAASYNLPLFPTTLGALLHVSFHSGLVKALSFGGLCKEGTCISDRFFVGGPLQLRGFQQSGIGPRAEIGGSLTPQGDSLGGEIFYTSTVACSIPFPFSRSLRDAGFRCMCFGNVGTLSGWGVPMIPLIRSTRASVGAGITLNTTMGKMEATYSFPLRYGPRDIRQQAQFGFGFIFGG